MASLMDDLTQVLENETVEYKKLIELSDNLRKALIESDVSTVEQMTAAQEEVSNGIQSLESRRARIMNDIAVVLNKKPEELKVSMLEETLAGQPALQQRLAAVRTELKQTMDELKRINHRLSSFKCFIKLLLFCKIFRYFFYSSST